jgi:beta-N-acetylhexosaminidase
MYLQNKINKILVLSILAVISIPSLSQQKDPPFLKYLNHPWVDSVLKTLTLEQRIAQCIWIAGYSNRDVSHEVEVSDIIKKFRIGGIVFFQGTAEKQAELINYYQKISNVPLIFSMDAEWGPGMRLQGVEKFPYQMTLGAIENDSLIYRMGRSVAAQLKRIGVHINLAPVVDINNNPLNPVINFRSFGDNRERVTSKALMYMNGMQENGILATLKHFPGHGDTRTDSHLDLPVIPHSRQRLDSLELFPFLNLITAGAGAVMTAHLNLPSLDSTSKLPSTLSPVIINDLLKTQLGFKGLVITDAMNMKGVTKYFSPGVADARALKAGNDVVEFVTDVEAAIRETMKMIKSKELPASEIDSKCKKILAAKYWAGLSHIQPVNGENISSDLSSPVAKALIRNLFSEALTVLNNNNDIIPLKDLPDLKAASIAINRPATSNFQQRLADYIPVDAFIVNPDDEKQTSELFGKLSGYNLVIAGIYGTDQRSNMNFGINPELNNFLKKLIGNNRTIVVYFGNPYALDRLDALQKSDGLVLAYQENEYTEDLCAQLIFGGIGAHGKLPVNINQFWPSGFGIVTPGGLRVSYGLPENAGLSSENLTRKVDSIANSGIKAKAYPGCEVMIARKGIVIFRKAYGYHTYENRIEVRDEDLFDLASVTKISSTLAGLMLLDSEGKFSPEKKLGDYLPDFRKTNKGGLLMKDILTHQAGLTPFIPFHRETIKPLEVANDLFINKNYRKKLFDEIKKSPLGEKKYVYSDLAFIISPGIIEKLTGRKWNEFVADEIWHKLGAYDMVFNPYRKYSPDRLVPTEYDTLFRRQLLHGTVHDEAASMQGGISGHAGLFATANDLMKLLEMYRRMGDYGGEQLINGEVLKRYSTVQFPENNNRRGLGFDKPSLNNDRLTPENVYPCKSATPESFGHSGYTGTFVWVDPVYEISYIFFCNRVYPTRYNNLLSDMNIRTNILQVIYDSVEDEGLRTQDAR